MISCDRRFGRNKKCLTGFLASCLVLYSYQYIQLNLYESLGRPMDVEQRRPLLSKFLKNAMGDFLARTDYGNVSINGVTIMQLPFDGKKERNHTCSAIECFKNVCFENMLCYKLPPLLPQFKNPCFYEQVSEDDSDQNVYKNYILRRMMPNLESEPIQKFHSQWQKRRTRSSTQLRCLPYFFVIGMEKSGTTDLYQRLNMHHQLVLTVPKEMQWWTRRRFFYSVNDTFPRGHEQSDESKLAHVEHLVSVPFKHYYAFYDHIADKIESHVSSLNGMPYHDFITGDGSPNTMYWNDFLSIFNQGRDERENENLVAQHIASVLPKSKIIAILRNPIDRLYSSYLFFNAKPDTVSFHSIVSRGIALFNNCTTTRSVRYCVYSAQLKEQVGSTVNLMQGLYSVMLEDWFSVFPASQIKVIQFETYKSSGLEVMNDVFEFLGVSTVKEGDLLEEKLKEKGAALSGKRYSRAGMMLEKTNELLRQFYQPFNAKLVNLLNDTRYYW